MKIMIVGADGQLGSDLQLELQPYYSVIPLVYEDGDITESDVVRQLLETHDPHVVINTAAFHNVPLCEDEPGKAFAVNGLGARNLAAGCRMQGSKLIHISTDYVFDGKKKSPYAETDIPRPLNVYAITKLAGEHFVAAETQNHMIVRVSGIYGKQRCMAKGRNFINAMLQQYRAGKTIRVVTDEILTPTSTVEIARQIREMIREHLTGLFHVSAEGACSWHAFAQAIFDILNLDVSVQEARVADFPPGVMRPH